MLDGSHSRIGNLLVLLIIIIIMIVFLLLLLHHHHHLAIQQDNTQHTTETEGENKRSNDTKQRNNKHKKNKKHTLTRHCTQQKPRNLPSNTRCLCEGRGYNTVPFHAYLVSPIATSSTFFLGQPYIRSFSYLPTTTSLHGKRNDLSIYLDIYLSIYLSRYI